MTKGKGVAAVRTVVVTGATGGLGAGVVEGLIAAEYDVIGTWIVPEERDRARERFGERVEWVELDVGSPDAVDDLAARLRGEGRPWGVAHLVGGFHAGDPVPGMDLDAFDAQMALNLRSAAVVMRGFLPGMVARSGGRFVSISSRAAVRPFGGGAAYAASKAGVIALTAAASEDVKSAGVTVNCLLPSVIDTPGNRVAMPDADPSEWVAPRQIGVLIGYLLSDGAAAVTGAALPVNGRV